MVLARIAILIAAAGALLAGLAAGSPPPRARAAPDQSGYVCPMHRQVKAGTAGECPICRMALVPREDAASTDAPGAAERWRHHLTRVQSRLTSREIVAPAWTDGPSTVSALLYDDEIALLDPHQAADFATAGERPREGGRGGGLAPAAVVRIDEPPRRWDVATSLVRFEVRPEMKRHAAVWPTNTNGWIVLATPTRTILVVRRDAVLPSPAGPYLLVASDDLRALTRRPVQIGRTVAGYATLVAGAREGERVAGSDSFFVDAGDRLAGPAR